MSLQLKGKLFLGAIGAALGGLPGFAIGAVLGHFAIDQRAENKENSAYKAYQRRQGQFLYYAFALGAKIAKSDGAVSRAEILHMERMMRQQFRLNDKTRSMAIKIWKEAKDSDRPFSDYATEFYKGFSTERPQVLTMLDLLFSIAAADGRLHPREEALLLHAAGIFRIGKLQFERIKSRYFHVPQERWTPSDPHYAILGVSPADPVDVIRKKYRELAQQWHPDKLVSKGASPEALRHAEKKFQEINEAYEKIMELKKS